jgi:hypothetical protein
MSALLGSALCAAAFIASACCFQNAMSPCSRGCDAAASARQNDNHLSALSHFLGMSGVEPDLTQGGD